MEAIVLSRTDVREYDQMIAVYTRDWGKRELLARGVKKAISKNSPHLGLGVLAEIDVALGKEFRYLTTAQAIVSFGAVHGSLPHLLVLQHALHLIETLTHPDEPDQRIFSLIKDFLFELETTSSNFLFSLDRFAIRLLSLLGFTPVLHVCVVCGRVPEAYNLSPRSGGRLCASCAENISPIDCIRATEADVSALVACLSSGQEVLSAPQLHQFVYQFLLYHTEKKIADWGKMISTLVK